MPVLFRRAKENSRRATDLTENGETKKIESPWYLERRYRRAGCPACTARVSCFSHRANHSPLRFPSLPALLPLLPLLSSPWRSPYTPVSSSPATANALAEKARLFYTPPLAPFHTLLLPSPPRFYSPDDRPFRSFNLFQPRPPPPVFGEQLYQPRLRLADSEHRTWCASFSLSMSLVLAPSLPLSYDSHVPPRAPAQGASSSFSPGWEKGKGQHRATTRRNILGSTQGIRRGAPSLFARVFTHVDQARTGVKLRPAFSTDRQSRFQGIFRNFLSRRRVDEVRKREEKKRREKRIEAGLAILW